MKAALVPVSEPPALVAVMVLPAPATVTVTLSVRVPAENAPDTLGLIVPAVVLRLAVPVKFVKSGEQALDVIESVRPLGVPGELNALPARVCA